MKSDSGRQLYGLIGYPVKHSYSPFMHRAAFAHYRMEADYQLFEVAPKDLEAFLRKTVPAKKIRGFNVTVPHKESVLGYLNGYVAADVRRYGAANTVRVEEGGRLSGFNTDAAGFAEDLAQHNVDVRNARVALIGAGGGARAVAMTVAAGKPARLLIYDSDEAKARRLAGAANDVYPGTEIAAVGAMEDLKIEDADILVNATPVGMKAGDPALIAAEALHAGLFVYDLIYNPGETKLLKSALGAGCRVANGLGMLLYQGCLAFERWTGKKAPVDVMRRALEERMKAI